MRLSRRARYRATSITPSRPPVRFATSLVLRLLLRPYSTRTPSRMEGEGKGPGRLHGSAQSRPAVAHQRGTVVPPDCEVHQLDERTRCGLAPAGTQRRCRRKLAVARGSRTPLHRVAAEAVGELGRRLQCHLAHRLREKLSRERVAKRALGGGERATGLECRL